MAQPTFEKLVRMPMFSDHSYPRNAEF